MQWLPGNDQIITLNSVRIEWRRAENRDRCRRGSNMQKDLLEKTIGIRY